MTLLCQNVSFAFPGDGELLNRVSLEAKPGEVLGLLGPNGSGKTTLIRLMTGELRPDEGNILLYGKPISAIPAKDLAKQMALVPQSAPPPDGFTALDIVLMGRHAHIARFGRESESDLEIALNAMKQTGVDALSERNVCQLSGGEWQRVLVARALAQESKVLLLDEPVSNLDIRYQLEVLHLISALAQTGLTVVVVMHDINLAARFCDTIAMIHKGALVALGKPVDVLTEARMEKVYGVTGKIISGSYPRFEPD